MSIEVGMTNRVEKTVTKELLASSVGSGALDVFATPNMICLMEEASFYCVRDAVEEGYGTVGTLVNIKHLAPTPLGSKVYCDATLIEIDGRRLVFDVKAYDESGLIGEGLHERFIINEQKFMDKVNAKQSR